MRTNASLATIISIEKFPVARTILTVVASLAALSSINSPAAQAEDTCAKPTTVRIQEWTGDIINIVPWVADSKDMFRKHYLDVKFLPLVAGPGAIVAAFMRSAFEGAGMDASAAAFIAVGGVTTVVPALKGRVVDAAMMFGTGPELAEAGQELGLGHVQVRRTSARGDPELRIDVQRDRPEPS
jgi:ABC-type nitrate/sulfonate/bicarbonate transport system substrate-binding protein